MQLMVTADAGLAPRRGLHTPVIGDAGHWHRGRHPAQRRHLRRSRGDGRDRGRRMGRMEPPFSAIAFAHQPWDHSPSREPYPRDHSLGSPTVKGKDGHERRAPRSSEMWSDARSCACLPPGEARARGSWVRTRLTDVRTPCQLTSHLLCFDRLAQDRDPARLRLPAAATCRHLHLELNNIRSSQPVSRLFSVTLPSRGTGRRRTLMSLPVARLMKESMSSCILIDRNPAETPPFLNADIALDSFNAANSVYPRDHVMPVCTTKGECLHG